jgi:hypothetical protein
LFFVCVETSSDADTNGESSSMSTTTTTTLSATESSAAASSDKQSAGTTTATTATSMTTTTTASSSSSSSSSSSDGVLSKLKPDERLSLHGVKGLNALSWCTFGALAARVLGASSPDGSLSELQKHVVELVFADVERHITTMLNTIDYFKVPRSSPCSDCSRETILRPNRRRCRTNACRCRPRARTAFAARRRSPPTRRIDCCSSSTSSPRGWISCIRSLSHLVLMVARFARLCYSARACESICRRACSSIEFSRSTSTAR